MKKVIQFPTKFIDDTNTIFEEMKTGKYDYMMLVEGEHELDYCSIEQMEQWKIVVVKILEK